MDIKQALGRIASQLDLSTDEMKAVMRQIMTGQCTDAQIGAFMMGMRMKSETIDEIVGAVQVMRELAAPVHFDTHRLVDTCGTGGDGMNIFNVSTAAAFVVAAAGGRVAKHGNRAVSGKSGSADLLEAAGVHLDLTPEQVARSVDAVGVGFMFAPAHHAAMKHAAPVRKDLGVRTIFNILGPLTNPAGAKNQVMGVFHPDLVGIQVRVLHRLGSKHVMVVYGLDGLDEISISGPTMVGELVKGEINEYNVHPGDLGMELYDRRAIEVHTVAESKAMIQAVLEGQPGPAHNIVALNAGAAVYVAGVAKTMKAGVQAAAQAIKSGAAKKKLEEFVAFTQKLKKA